MFSNKMVGFKLSLEWFLKQENERHCEEGLGKHEIHRVNPHVKVTGC